MLSLEAKKLIRRCKIRKRREGRSLVKRLKFHSAAIKFGLSEWRQFLVRGTSSSYNFSFETLTPTEVKPDQYRRYETELLKGLLHRDVRNIAITGKYGAGKSSLLKTFAEAHTEYNYAWISLASFGKERLRPENNIESASDEENSAVLSQSETDNESNSELIKQIEETIVQQLLYSVPSQSLPQTRLKRITQVPASSVIWYTILSLGWGVSVASLYLANFGSYGLTHPQWAIEMLSTIPAEWALSIALVSSLYGLHKLLRILLNIKIDGLTVKGGKVEIAKEGTALHKNVDELIYCFEQSEIDVVIIEDLDRFNIQDVFFRLREINFIVKNCPQITRPIHFIYALREEFFGLGEKTKFFDLVIPIIPFVNSANSGVLLMQLLKNKSLNADLSAELIETLSYHLDDMRLIKNIVNEYDIYLSALRKSITNLDCNRLFAMTFIRNVYPDEYVDLTNRKGVLYNLLLAFDKHIDSQHRELQQQLKIQLEELDRYRSLFTTKKKELRSLVYLRMREMAGVSHEDTVSYLLDDNRTRISVNDFIDDEDIFNKLTLNSVTVTLHADATNYSQTGTAVKVSQLMAAGFPPYKSAFTLLEKSEHDRSVQIEVLKKNIRKINSLGFDTAHKDEVFLASIPKICPDLRALPYLVRSSFFGSDYQDYIGYFYPGAQTSNDKEFLVAIRNRELCPVSVKLDDPGAVLKKLKSSELAEGRGLVCALIAYLDTAAVGSQDAMILATILEDAHRHIDRLVDVLLELKHQPFHNLFRELSLCNPECLSLIFTQAERPLDSYDQELLLHRIVSSLYAEDFESIPREHLEAFVTAIEKFDMVSSLYLDLESGLGGWGWLRQRPIQFHNLSESNSLDALRYLIDLRCVKLNLRTLKVICNRLWDNRRPGTISYTELKRLPSATMMQLVNENLNFVVGELLTQDGELEESEESLLFLLSEVDTTLGSELIEKTSVAVENIQSVSEDHWVSLVSKLRVKLNASNLSLYFERFIVEEANQLAAEAFFHYLEANLSDLRVALRGDTSDLRTRLQVFLLEDEDLDDERFRNIFVALLGPTNNFSTANASAHRWKTVVALKNVPYSSELREVVAAQGEDLLSEYLLRHWGEAANDVDPNAIPIAVLVKISTNNEVTLQKKIELWSRLDANRVANSLQGKNELMRICAEANRQQMFLALPSNSETLFEAVSDSSLAEELRKEGLIQLLQYLSQSKLNTILNTFSESGFGVLAQRSKYKFSLEDTDVNSRLTEALKNNGCIASYSRRGDVITVNMKRSPR